MLEVASLISQHPNSHIIVTGHSLGAALASFAAVELRNTYKENLITFYTYGSPRVGNQVFTDYTLTLFPEGGNQRVTHFNDIVPHLPPTVFGFNHMGDEVWYSKTGADLSYIECHNHVGGRSEDLKCSDSIVASGIEAHLMYLGQSLIGICD